MKAKVTAFHYDLKFKIPGGTSRGVLTQKKTYFLYAQQDKNWGIGECNLFEGLSYDDRSDFDPKIREVAAWIETHFEQFFDASTSLESFYDLWDLKEYPSIQFGLEQLKSSFLKFSLYIRKFLDFLIQKKNGKII